jgi:hypothetical protein
MAIQSFKMGPGSLTFDAQVASAQVTAFKVEADESVKTTDAIPVLSGEELAAQETASLAWKATGTLIQDIAAADLVAWSWTNAGEEVGFTFVPNTVSDRQVTGVVRVVPIALGGDVEKRNTSDISWAIIGTPVLGDLP